MGLFLGILVVHKLLKVQKLEVQKLKLPRLYI